MAPSPPTRYKTRYVKDRGGGSNWPNPPQFDPISRQCAHTQKIPWEREGYNRGEGRGKITASCFQSNSWRSNRMLGPGGRQEAGDVVRGQQEGATNFWNVPTYFYRVTRRVILKKFPTPPHASNFCLRVNDVVTRIMTRLPSSAFGK